MICICLLASNHSSCPISFESIDQHDGGIAISDKIRVVQISLK